MDNEYIEKYYHFLQHLKLAENYHAPYLLEGGENITRNPILEQILPSLLYVQMVSLFDEGLLRYMDINELFMPKKRCKNDLNGRIQFLSDNRLIKDSKECHRVRKKRNDIAHESAINASWDGLNNDLSIVELELKNLGLIGDRPNYVFYAERAAARDSKEENVICAWDYYFGLKEDGKKIIEISWTSKMMKS
jgi:hypothetical protein